MTCGFGQVDLSTTPLGTVPSQLVPGRRALLGSPLKSSVEFIEAHIIETGTQSYRLAASKTSRRSRPGAPWGASGGPAVSYIRSWQAVQPQRQNQAGAMDAPGWASVPGPKYYDPQKARDAFAYLAEPGCNPRWAASSIRAAVGNDHAGTLYPAAVAATSRLLEVIQAGPGRPREAALHVLLDWWGMFQPEPGYEKFTEPSGRTVELLPAVIKVGRTARALLTGIVADDPSARKLARELIKRIDAGWETAGQPT
jgi:hypothetical protein